MYSLCMYSLYGMNEFSVVETTANHSQTFPHQIIDYSLFHSAFFRKKRNVIIYVESLCCSWIHLYEKDAWQVCRERGKRRKLIL